MAETDWETCKENFIPLKAGRKPGALRDATAELRSQQLEAQRNAFWEELAAYQGDDPLEVWLRFIKWTQEAFSAGGHKAELLPLLERCTRELQGVEAYRTDVRYLRVWIQYADCLPDPGDVFSFLKEKNIGQKHALYYIAHATYLEFRGNYARADAAYQQGINRLAAPVERLRAKYQEFQHRMARRIQRKAQEQSEGSLEPDHPERKTLGLLGGRRGGAGACARPGGGGLGGGLGGFKRKADAENAPVCGGGSGLDIFVDEEFSAGGAEAASAPATLLNPGRSTAGASWNKLAGFEATRKENMARPGVWAGQRIKQAAAHSAPAAAPLEIFVDPELEDAASGGSDSPVKGGPTLRQRLDKAGGLAQPLEEGLMADPLRLHKAQAPVLPPLPGGAKAVAGSSGLAAAPDAKRRREERMAFDEGALTSSAGEELSFEEVRAMRRAAAAEAAAKQLAEVSPAESEAEQPATEVLHVPEPTEQLPHIEPLEAVSTAVAAGASQPASHSLSQQQGGGEDQALLGRPTPFDQPVDGDEEAESGLEPTITINTRDAFAAINGMFGGSGGGLLPSLHSSALDSNVTISTREAFAAVNQMFRGGLPSEAGGSLPMHPHAEPTMALGDAANLTISTKSAFAAINRMFRGALPTEHGCLPPTSFSEPTITINTKEAFAAINGMFGGAVHLGQEAAGGQAGGDGFCVPPPRQKLRARSQPPPAGHPATTVGQQHPEEGGCGGSLFVREDTQFLGGLAPASPASPEEAGALGGGGGGFSIREDTLFFAPGQAPQQVEVAGTALRGLGAQKPSPTASPTAGGGFCIREDTMFISAPPPSPSASPVSSAGARPPLGGRAASGNTADLLGGGGGDNLSLPLSSVCTAASAGQVNKWGFAPGAEDTMALDLGGDTAVLLGEAAGLAAAAAGAGPEATISGAGTSGLTLHMRALQLSEGKENLVAPGAAVPPGNRDIHAAGLAALQPLDAAHACQASVEVSEDEEAEAALAEGAALPRDDSFDVFFDSDSPRRINNTVNSDGCDAAASQQLQQVARSTPTPTIDPFQPGFQARLLASLDPPITEWPGVLAVSPEEEEAAETGFREAARSSAALVELWLGGAEFAVSACVGQGAYAKVFQGVDGECADVALKVESPPCPWEWYICKALQGRLPEAARAHFIDPHVLLLGARSSVLVAPFGACGSLQDAINAYLAAGAPPPEAVALHFATELLGLLGHLAAARVLHADIKPDNLLLTPGRGEGGDENAVPGVGLQLIDFGRSIDLELLPPGTLLCGDSDTDAFRCVEMRECRPWLWQADAYGVAATVHCLLFGDYMEVERVQAAGSGEAFLRLRRPFKRQWAGQLWDSFFHTLLNRTDSSAPPPTAELLARFEAHLAGREAARQRGQELGRLIAMLQAGTV